MPSTGMVAGNFLHRTSRALDPHLHTHLVVANVAEGVDGALVDGGQQADLRPPPGGPARSTTPACGWSWPIASARRGRCRPTGLGDVVGVDADACAGSSPSGRRRSTST